eukprot:GHVR01002175.1.p1 GENE.GHVR01002175.1~~GHVR01002175.1.p1  ORF type:complete len:375 (-),score=118.47 GHVR01002175.1:737-1861(-)
MEGGDETYDIMLKSIRNAKKRVWLETYIFDSSKIAQCFVDELKSSSLRGVDVILIIDWVGGFDMKTSMINTLIQSGVNVIFFNPFIGSGSIGPWMFREHRKILITDDKAFVGSLNVSNDAAGYIYGGTNHFYDVHACVEGPAVVDLGDVFIDTLRVSRCNLHRDSIKYISSNIYNNTDTHTKTDTNLSSSISPCNNNNTYTHTKVNSHPTHSSNTHNPTDTNDAQVLHSHVETLNATSNTHTHTHTHTHTLTSDNVFIAVLSSNVAKHTRDIQFALKAALQNAETSVCLSTSYMMPPGFLRRALLATAARGARVSLLLSGKSDVPLDMHASTHLARKFLRRDCSVYFLERQHMHAKHLAIDGVWGSLGSFNWDR